jgi:hypothetical protein
MDEAHRRFSMANHEMRRLELDLDTAKVALATSEGELAAAQAAIIDAQARIACKGFPHLDVRMHVWSL